MDGSVSSAAQTVADLRGIAARADALLALPIEEADRTELQSMAIRASSFADTIERQPPEASAAIVNMSGGSSALVRFATASLAEMEAKYA